MHVQDTCMYIVGQSCMAAPIYIVMQILLITYNYSTSVCMQLATAHIMAIIILCYFDNLHDQLSL